MAVADEAGEFVIRVRYFKPSGKWYTDGEYTFRGRAIRSGPDLMPYMNDVVAQVRGWRDGGGQGALPGLASGTWDGFILVDCDGGFPCLIVPPGV